MTAHKIEKLVFERLSSRMSKYEVIVGCYAPNLDRHVCGNMEEWTMLWNEEYPSSRLDCTKERWNSMFSGVPLGEGQ
jgi:hypothetical protein